MAGGVTAPVAASIERTWTPPASPYSWKAMTNWSPVFMFAIEGGP